MTKNTIFECWCRRIEARAAYSLQHVINIKEIPFPWAEHYRHGADEGYVLEELIKAAREAADKAFRGETII